VLGARYPEVEPWEGDGIDVLFNLPDTGWRIDAALRPPKGALVVTECRRHVSSIKQVDVALFADRVKLPRKRLDVPFSGYFIVQALWDAPGGHLIAMFAERVGALSRLEVHEPDGVLRDAPAASGLAQPPA
jgi:hypothetical protein